jgi:arylsulfatase A-like enzyme
MRTRKLPVTFPYAKELVLLFLVATISHPHCVRAVSRSNDEVTNQPNFIIIFTDDQGYQDLGCFGSPNIKTPRIDQMANEGMRFTNFYAQTVCGPSRAALMTGCYPLRVARQSDPDSIHPELHSKEITIAEVLKNQGYATGAFGKWDLAGHRQKNYKPDLLPTHQGFDTYFGTPGSNDAAVNLIRGTQLIETNVEMASLTKRYTDEAITFIEDNRDGPFFIYLAHTMPHTKLAASKQFKGKSAGGLYGDVIEELDFHVGRVLDKVSELGLDENTYTIFTSDNGPWLIRKKHSGHALPLRSGKTTCWEGGMRVPCIVRAPGNVPAGKTCNAVAATIDLLPTIASLAGTSCPDDRVIDGVDISQLIHGTENHLERNFFYFQHDCLRAVRSGKWKLLLPHTEPIKGGIASRWKRHVNKADAARIQTPQLYDLEKDVSETTNLASENPEMVARLTELAVSAQNDIGDHDRFGTNARTFGAARRTLSNASTTSESKESDSKALESGSRKLSPGKTSTPRLMDKPKQPIPTKNAKPNFIVIFADDLGYGDIRCYHPKAVETPHLDALATEGFRSTDFFVPANVCSPSRAALLTGRYPMRCGMPVARFETPGSKYKDYGFLSEEITIPELLKPAGYHSLMVGKWHLGMEVEGSHPIDAGFDEHLGIPSNYGKNRGPNYNTLYRGKAVEKKNVRCEELTNRYTDEVVNFIQRQKNEPFFIYISHHIVHSPLLPSKDFAGKSSKGKYGDFVQELDHSTGRIMKTIKDAGLDENTLVVFTSDNGPSRAGSSGALNGGKYCTMEGGHRVPGIFRWPGKIAPNQVSNVTMTSMDLLPLFCELAGVEQPADRKIDGKNILSVLQGKETQTPHELLYYYNGTNLQAVREGKWKLHLPRTTNDQPFWSKKKDKTKGFVTLNDHQLFDLNQDLGEKKNVADQNPQVVDRLLKHAEAIRAELGDVHTIGADQRKIKLVDPQER